MLMTDLDNPTDPPGWPRDHLRRYLATDGAEGHEWKPGVHTLLLTTKGRRSGKARRTPLIYGRDGNQFVSSRPRAVPTSIRSGTATLWPTRTSRCRSAATASPRAPTLPALKRGRSCGR